MTLTLNFGGQGAAGARMTARRVLLIAALGLAACSGALIGSGAAPSHIELVAATNQAGATVVTTREEVSQLRSFFSPQSLRETVFTGDTRARLAGGAHRETGGRMDVSRVNVGPEGAMQGRGEYYTDIEGEEILIEPLPRQPVMGGQWRGPESGRTGGISLNFDNEPLPQVVRNVLGGILQFNYIIGNSVQGNVTFRSERRFTQPEVLQVLADVLARNGYMIQYFNSVYHVGTPAELETLTGLRARSNLAGDSSHVIAMRRAPPENLVQVVNSLIPSGNTVSTLDGSNNLVVRGDPSQFQSIEELVRSLVESRPGIQALAIIPVRRTPPEAIVEQITTLYAQRGLGDVTILPVSTAPGVLVVANSRQTIAQISELVRNLDVENRDSPQVRIIQLAHLDAQELASRLSSIVGDAPLVPNTERGSTDPSSSVIAAAIQSANDGESARGVTSSGVRAPRFLRGSDDAEPEAAPRVSRTGAPGTGSRSSGEGITFTSDPRNNALLVRSNFVEFQRIQEVVRALDIPLAQVVIEATIIEVDINDQLQYGVQMFLQGAGFDLRSSSGAGTSGDPGGGGFVALLGGTIGSTSVQAVISALQSVTNVQVISSPYLTVVDGATSRLNVGDQIPFVIASQTSQSGGTVTVTQEVETRDVGVILDVTPRINPNNAVMLNIVQEVSSARSVQTAAGQNPVISQRRVQSQIVVQSGATALLGGLIQERTDTAENGVPVLRRIPVVGDLFNRTSNTMQRTELLVMITPRVVRNADGLDTLSRQLRMLTVRR